MSRLIGTVAKGVRAPIIKQGDDLVSIVVDCILNASKEENQPLKEKDIIAITESTLARAQGNYIDVDDITKEINNKYNDSIGLVFPILSRNRFSIILKAIALSKKKVFILLNYPSDEVGNSLMDLDTLTKSGINPYTDVLSEEQYREVFGENIPHLFTGVDYVSLYKNLAINDNIEIILSNNPLTILDYTKDVLIANIHEREELKKLFLNNGANIVHSLNELNNVPVDGKGYNPEFGILGSNIATENTIKLFPRDSKKFVIDVKKLILEKTNINVEVMIYGDGAFKDPVCKIWELADPVVSPGYTSGLEGIPNELKIKYIADTQLSEMDSETSIKEMKKLIEQKDNDLTGNNMSLGTTPRKLTDLIGSLCDLISGSGDKGTPIVWISGYFDNFSNN